MRGKNSKKTDTSTQNNFMTGTDVPFGVISKPLFLSIARSGVRRTLLGAHVPHAKSDCTKDILVEELSTLQSEKGTIINKHQLPEDKIAGSKWCGTKQCASLQCPRGTRRKGDFRKSLQIASETAMKTVGK